MDAPLQICRRFRYEHTFLYKYAYGRYILGKQANGIVLG